MTQFEVNVAPEGINLFDIAIQSHNYLSNTMATSTVKTSYGTEHPGEDTNQHGGTYLDTFEFEAQNIAAFNQNANEEEAKKEKFESFRDEQRFKEIPIKPTEDELQNMVGGIEELHRKYDDELRYGAENMSVTKSDISFGRAGKFKTAGLWRIVTAIFVLLF